MGVPVFTMLVGLPGSGKSTIAEKISKNTGAIICSSDAIRLELFNDINYQGDNDLVFDTMLSRAISGLKAGKDVVYDATNLYSKNRIDVLYKLGGIKCRKHCLIMATPFTDCCIRNEFRDREVPVDVIISMYKHWQTPYWYEGWDSIEVQYPDNFTPVSIDNWLRDHMNYNQDTPSHTKTLGKHCADTAKQFKTITMFYAGLLHDCGKPFVKDYHDKFGKETKCATYYGHQSCGAYDSLFFNYTRRVNPLDVSIRISLHMLPYFWRNDCENETVQRILNRKLWGNRLYKDVIRLNKADRTAH